jgi:eukaryotic-like serine/threonine-protein kinase
MTPERWAQIEDLFHRAVDSDSQNRTAMLEECCGTDLELRKQVEALLVADQSAHSNVQTAILSELEAVAFSLVGQIVSHYRIVEGMDGGGMGIVYRAEDVKLGRRVAMKFLPEESTKDPAALERFEREARSASTLEHPNICPVYEFGEHQGQPFLVMQLLEGHTLRDLIASAGPGKACFKLKELLDVAIQIARGLEAAHGQGIIHRDIKPGNIFLTSQGEVKILDFGLAKLAHADGEPNDPQAKVSPSPADRVLSRTGTAMGTVAYMSPEQFHGEKLDARTDLYSLGLVLHEIATGRREIVEKTTEFNPASERVRIPHVAANLEKIINRSLQEKREARYQTASEIRTDLEKLKGTLEPRHARRWAIAVGLVLVFISIASLWLAKRQQQPSPVPAPDLKLRQLTSNSAENHVLGGLISPNGKYLVYADLKGIHLKEIETNETRTLPQPDPLGDQKVQSDFAAWSPDSTRFLVNAHRAVIDPVFLEDKDVSVWEFPVHGGNPRRLRAMAWADSFSPDGSLIAFRTKKGRFGAHEIWLMDASGDNARKILESGEESAIGTFLWSPDGRRASYLRDNGFALTATSFLWDGSNPTNLKQSSAYDIEPLFDSRNAYDGLELPDGRTIFSVKETGTIGGETCNFWVVRVDPRTGQPIEKPRQLTHWTGFCMSVISATKDGKRLAFLQWSGHATLYVADLKASGTRMDHERHLTLSESSDFFGDWTPDSKSIVFWSNRDGQNAIYRQRLDDDMPQLLVTSRDQLGVGCVSPDGKWSIYFLAKESKDPRQQAQLMRVPLAGGTSQTILTTNRLEGWDCAKDPQGPCLLEERSDDRKQAVITAFDPLKGRGAELARIALDPQVDSWVLALSPNGKRLAVIRSPGSPLEILSLKGELLQQIKIPEWSNSGPVKWAADGKGLFVPSTADGEASLIYVNLRGDVHVLRRNREGDYSTGAPSPDGKHIAIVGTAQSRNFWMMEKF